MTEPMTTPTIVEFPLMSEEEGRRAVVAEARSWVGTPYTDGAGIKGVGTDCGIILIKVFSSVGLIPPFDPGYYSPQHHLHSSEERYLSLILRHAHEIEGPPKDGDIVMFKFGRVFSHGGIVVGWPKIVHSLRPGGTIIDNVERCIIGPRALAHLPRKYFSLW